MLKLAGFNSTIYSFNKKTGVSFTPIAMPKEKKHLRKKMEEEANDTMVILDQAQEDALQKIKNNMGVDSNNVKFCNPPIPILADLYKV